VYQIKAKTRFKTRRHEPVLQPIKKTATPVFAGTAEIIYLSPAPQKAAMKVEYEL
jgi:hypothetical protein